MIYTVKDGFPYYYNLVKGMNSKTLFSSDAALGFFETFDEEKATYRYADDKWSIKQIVGHLTDHERIKIYRAFMLSRNNEIELWGYDQNYLIQHSRFNQLTYEQVLSDYRNVRQASVSFIETLSNAQLAIKGKAREHEITLDDFLLSIIGHETHHLNVIKELYL